MLEIIFIVAIVIIGSALCSGAEMALFSVPVKRIKKLSETKKPGASTLLEIITEPVCVKTSLTIVVLNNVFNIVGSMVIGDKVGEMVGARWFAYVSAIMAFLIILYAEIFPKQIGRSFAERISLKIAVPISALIFFIGTPFYFIVSHIEKLHMIFIRRVFRIRAKSEKNDPVTEEGDIRFSLKEAYDAGKIEEDEYEMNLRVFLLNDTKAEDRMVIKDKMTVLKGSATLGECKEMLMECHHSRIVVIGDFEQMHILGVVLLRDLHVNLITAQDAPELLEKSIATFIRKPCIVVGHDTKADKLIDLFIARKQHLATVYKDGSVAGLVTFEDIIEVLTGRFYDETDQLPAPEGKK